MKTIAIANHKGGVGKTATTHNLGSILAFEYGLRVLMIDTDPQSSLTQSCGVSEAENNLAGILGNTNPGTMELADIIQDLGSGLYLAPSDISLAVSELGLTSRMGRENILCKAHASVDKNYDLCFIDCPPSLGLLTVISLVAADAVLTPTQPQVVDLHGLSLFLETLERIKLELNPELVHLGVLVTFFDNRLIHNEVAIKAMENADLPLLPVKIGRSIRVAEAAAAGEPVTVWDPNNPQAENYRKM
ncbi:MAG: ParA family protein, partial [Anaerolineales bacterium]|nr:ParA family protein [Anaerolineales bacterium]